MITHPVENSVYVFLCIALMWSCVCVFTYESGSANLLNIDLRKLKTGVLGIGDTPRVFDGNWGQLGTV